MPPYLSASECAAKWFQKLREMSAQLGNRGAVLVVTAVCAPVLIMIVGFACDYGYASYLNQRLARALDSGTLGSVSQTAATTAGGYDQTQSLQDIGMNVFNANMLDLPLTNVKASISVVSDGSGGVIATGTYNYNAPTIFSSFIGINSIPISGSTKTAAKPLVYINYYILVDNSQSMGIGATQTDMAALYSRVLAQNNASSTDGGCVFGCHIPGRMVNSSNKNVYQTYTNEFLAHDPQWGTPIKLRIDSAVDAVSSIVASAAQIAGINKNVSFGLYTLEVDPNTGNQVQMILNPPSTDYAKIQSAAKNIDLGNTIAYQNTGDTEFHGEFNDFLSAIAKPISPSTTPTPLTQGSGASATSPLNYIFLVTDGLTDIVGNCNKFKVCGSAINPNDCSVLKANATLGVIYTTYLPIYKNNTPPALEDRYATIVGETTRAQLAPALQSCATSSDWYFEAQDGPSLVSSMQTLFQRSQPITARMTQ